MSTRTITIAPGELIIAANIRKDTKLTDDFVASIALHGVLVPILAIEGINGVEVVDGQRRTLAAVAAGLEAVDVQIIREQEGDEQRIVEQIVVNEHREYLTPADHLQAVKQLSLFGVSAAAIAKQTGVKKDQVKSMLVVANSEAASAAMAAQPISLENAAIIAEFDGHPKAVEALVAETQFRGSIKHLASRLRTDIVNDEAKARMLAEIEAQGIVALDSAPEFNDAQVRALGRVFTDKKLKDAVTEETLLQTAGDDLRAYPLREYGRWQDGEREPDTWGIGYAVANWEAYGWYAHDYSTTTNKPPMTDAEKSERRQARENTKIWQAATAVRMEWLGQLVQRKTMPAGWEPFVVTRMVDNGSHGTAEWRAAIAILGLPDPSDTYSIWTVVARAVQEGPKTVLQTALAVALGAVEGGYEFDRKGWVQDKAIAYLRMLAGWGYELSELEQSIVDQATTK